MSDQPPTGWQPSGPTPPSGWGQPPTAQPTQPGRNRTGLVLAAAGGVIVVLLIVIGVLVSRESTGGGQATATTSPVSESTPEEIEGTEPTNPPPSTEPAPAPAKRFGQTTTYDDDTIIQVVRVGKGQIGPYAAGGSRARDHLVKVTVKITAGGDAIDLSPDVTLQYGAGGQTAETVFDEGIDAMQEAPRVLRAERTVTGVFGFAVPRGQTNNLVITATPSYEYVEATFEGRA
jgi:hypothetical protein